MCTILLSAIQPPDECKTSVYVFYVFDFKSGILKKSEKSHLLTTYNNSTQSLET